MRFGIVTPRVGTNDGQGRVNREIAVEALRQGHEVVLFSEHVDDDIAARDGVMAEVTAPPAWVPSRLLRDQVFALRSYARIRSERNQCHALLANGFVSWVDSDINAVHFMHRSWAGSRWHPWRLRRDARSFYALAYSQVNIRLEKIAFDRGRRLVAVSNQVRRELLEMGFPPDRVIAIANGVDCQEFRPGSAERGRFGLPDGVLIGVFAGDLRSPRKNLDTVLRALTAVPGLHLAVAGRTEGTPYPAQAQALGIADRVHFLGFQTDMPALLRSVDLLILPSRYEPFGLVFLEALASGLPVVTARNAGGAEIVAPDVGVVLDDCEDHAALAAALRQLAADDDRRTAMARRARTVAEAHSWQVTAARYLDLLCEAADRRRRGYA
jgi:glycosyltransferase involved in cell wall biosynthesis